MALVGSFFPLPFRVKTRKSPSKGIRQKLAATVLSLYRSGAVVKHGYLSSAGRVKPPGGPRVTSLSDTGLSHSGFFFFFFSFRERTSEFVRRAIYAIQVITPVPGVPLSDDTVPGTSHGTLRVRVISRISDARRSERCCTRWHSGKKNSFAGRRRSVVIANF